MEQQVMNKLKVETQSEKVEFSVESVEDETLLSMAHTYLEVYPITRHFVIGLKEDDRKHLIGLLGGRL